MKTKLYVLTYDVNTTTVEDLDEMALRMKQVVAPNEDFMIMPNQFQLSALDEDSIIQLKDYLEDLLYKKHQTEEVPK